MRRLGRWVFNALTIFSMIVCLTALVCWPTTWSTDFIHRNQWWIVESRAHNLRISRTWLTSLDTPKGADSDWNLWSAIDYFRFSGRGGGTGYIAVAWWFIALLAAILPACRGLAILTRTRRKRHRLKHGLCLSCGYDLRASTDRCPECGSEMTRAQPSLHV